MRKPAGARVVPGPALEVEWTAYCRPVVPKGPEDPIFVSPGDDPRASADLLPGEKIKVLHGSGKKDEGLQKRALRACQTKRRAVSQPRKAGRKAPSVDRLLTYRELHPELFVGVRPFALGGAWTVGPVEPPTDEYLARVRRGEVPGVQYRNGLIETYVEVPDWSTHNPPPTEPLTDANAIAAFWKKGNFSLFSVNS